MRRSLGGGALAAVLAALVVAVVVGIGNDPVPLAFDAVLVELVEDADGQPMVALEDDGTGTIDDLAGRGGTLLIRPDQLICQGGSLIDAGPGDVVAVDGVRGEPTEGAPPLLLVDRVVIDCS